MLNNNKKQFLLAVVI